MRLEDLVADSEIYTGQVQLYLYVYDPDMGVGLVSGPYVL
jgi:hypothetical protein